MNSEHSINNLHSLPELISEISIRTSVTFPFKKAASVFDLDGTLVNVTAIEHFVTGEVHDFNSFHESSIDCPSYEKVAQIARSLIEKNHIVIVLSGRQERFRSITNFWLAMQSLPVQELYLRPNNFHGDKVNFKIQALKEISYKYEIKSIFDNDPKLLSLWKELDIPFVIKCPELTNLKAL